VPAGSVLAVPRATWYRRRRRQISGDTEIRKQQSHRLGLHRRAPIRVNGELAGGNVLRAATVLDEPLGQLGAFAMGDHPADHIAAENIQDHIEMIVGPLRWATQLQDCSPAQVYDRVGGVIVCAGMRAWAVVLLVRG
jgi:hypothetical protein